MTYAKDMLGVFATITRTSLLNFFLNLQFSYLYSFSRFLSDLHKTSYF